MSDFHRHYDEQTNGHTMLASENYPSLLCRNGESLRLVCSTIAHAGSIYRAIKNKAPFEWETGLLSQSSFFYKNKWYMFIMEMSVSLSSNMCVCVCVIDRMGWMVDSLPPCGYHDHSVSVILAGSCSSKWDFLGDYSL